MTITHELEKSFPHSRLPYIERDSKLTFILLLFYLLIGKGEGSWQAKLNFIFVWIFWKGISGESWGEFHMTID